MSTEPLTAADFARCMGYTTTPAMEADVLDAPTAEETARAFLAERVTAIRAAWDAYNTAAAPFEAEIASLHKQIAAARKAGQPHQWMVNAVDHLDLMRSDFAATRNRAIEAAEDEIQARFGYADWTSRDRCEFPHGWKP